MRLRYVPENDNKSNNNNNSYNNVANCTVDFNLPKTSRLRHVKRPFGHIILSLGTLFMATVTRYHNGSAIVWSYWEHFEPYTLYVMLNSEHMFPSFLLINCGRERTPNGYGTYCRAFLI